MRRVKKKECSRIVVGFYTSLTGQMPAGHTGMPQINFRKRPDLTLCYSVVFKDFQFRNSCLRLPLPGLTIKEALQKTEPVLW